MAVGDFTTFEEAKPLLMDGTIDWLTGTIKVAAITSATTPAAADADPRFGAGGSTDLSTNEVAGAGYAQQTLGTKTITEAAGTVTVDSADFGWTQSGTGFTNARWLIVFQDDANDYAIGFVDLASDRSQVDGDVNLTTGSGFFTY